MFCCRWVFWTSLALAPLVSWPAEDASPAVNAPQSEVLVARVTLNTEDKGDLFVARTSDRDFLVKIEDLKALGFKDPSGLRVALEGEAYLSLRSMSGVTFTFEEKTLALSILAEPRLLPSRSLQWQGQRTRVSTRDSGNSAFFNYAMDYARSDSNPISAIGFSGELGWQFGDYLFLSDVNTLQAPDGRRRMIRLTSSVTRDDTGDLRRIVLGDFFTPSRDLSSGVNMGGVSLSKLYGLNPYLVQSPMQTVSGTVALPSDLEVYLDGQRIRSEKVRPGEFELRDIMAYGGARSIRLVLRDPFGRVQEFDYSFYFSDQPLARGLHEYSYNLGLLRRDFGVASNEYGGPAFTMFHRYGLSDSVTLGVRAEGARRFTNAGPTATVVLGSAGVVNLALATSSLAGRRGGAGSVAYTYQTRNWSVGLAARKDWGEYAIVGEPPSITTRRHEGNVVLSYHIPRYGAVSASHSVRAFRAPAVPQTQILHGLSAQKITTVSYSAPLIGGRASFTASLARITEKRSRNELTLRATVFFGREYSAVAKYQGNDAEHGESIQLTKNQPIGEGLGYILATDRSTDATRRVHNWSSMQYNAPAAIVRGEYGRRGTADAAADDYRLALAGGIAYVGGTLGFGRPVTGSFGIVKVGELADVAVTVNGQPMGKTNASGQLFVPTLTSYFDNDIAIAPDSVPIEYSIPATRKKVAPALRSGVVIDFGVTKVQAVTGKLKHDDEGVNKPLEFREIRFSVEGKSHSLQTGRGGEFYVENLKPGTYAATVPVEGKQCLFELVIPKSDETFVELGDINCRLTP